MRRLFRWTEVAATLIHLLPVDVHGGNLQMNIHGLAALRAFSTACLLLLAAVPAVTGAFAQGTEEERRACTPDVMRLCREFIPSVSAITQCLIDKRAELNPACKQVMAPEPTKQASAAAKKRATAKRGTRPAAAGRQTVSADPVARPVEVVPAPANTKSTRKKPKSARAPRGAAAAPADTSPQPTQRSAGPNTP
jgi:hypothetical protein